MPPKRKVKDREEEGDSPAPRRSTRSSAKSAKATSSTDQAQTVEEVKGKELQAPPAKKAKKTTGVRDARHTTATKVTLKGKGPSHPSFTPARALELFDTYRDEEVTDEDIIGSEGLEKFCTDTQLDMEGPKPLLLAWILGAKALGRFTKAEWSQGTSTWQVDTTDKFTAAINDVHDVLITETKTKSSSNPKTGKKKEVNPYNKALLHQYERDPSAQYRKFYLYLFDLLRPEQARNVDMEVATAIWSTILVPKYPLCGELIDFITEKKTYRGVNKDLWAMALEFCQEFDSDSLDKYETDGAWPTLMDDFASHWKASKEG